MTECLVNDMMDLVKMENGVFKITYEYFDLRMVVYKAFNIIKYQANHKKLKLIGLIEYSENIQFLSNVWGDQ